MSETASKHKVKAPTNLNFAIIVCSSSRYAKLKSGEEVTDSSGDLTSQVLRQHGHSVTLRTTVPDDRYQIEQTIKKALESKKVDVIITCGGTGISSTDVTIETVQPLLDKIILGFGEIFRKISYEQIGSVAILTRAIAGVSKGKIIFCVPGSPQAVLLSLEKLILPEAGHILTHTREK
ncbi:MogA/MoaB family molybdenum cofactor biosynthesis protein [Candidatus Bathyarchaeota archaeon]|nr:MogA/MoaB family molybdenum cofactor biosynthesis protein [Candidatus Bathyarchaeota archaeon]